MLINMSTTFSIQELTTALTTNRTNQNFSTPQISGAVAFRTLSGITGITILYFFICLSLYEAFFPEKPPAGGKLRIPLILTALAGVLFEITRALSLTVSNRSGSLCSAISLALVIQFILYFSLTYTFFWMRQSTCNSNPQLQQLPSKKRRTLSYFTLILIIFDSVTLITLLSIDPLFEVRNGLCIYIQYFPSHLRVFATIITYSFGFIQVSEF